MKRNTKTEIYDHVGIMNRARAARAKLVAEQFARLGRWFARNRADIFHGSGTRPA